MKADVERDDESTIEATVSSVLGLSASRRRPALAAVLRRGWDRVWFGLVVIDQEGRVLYANPGLERLTRLTTKETLATLQGRGPARLLDARGREVALQDLAVVAAAVSGRRHRGSLVRLARDSGPSLHLRCEAVSLDVGDGRPHLILLSLTPVRGEERRDEPARVVATRAQVLADLAKALAEGMVDVDAVTHVVADRISDWWRDVCIVSLLDAESESITISACAHPDPAVAAFYRGLESQQRLRPGEGLTGTVVATGRPVVLQSMPGRELLRSMVPPHREWFRRHAPPALRDLARKSVSLALLPLIARGETLGTLAVGGAGDHAEITEGELIWLQEVADVCALAIANARLYREASDRLRMLEAARRVDLAMVASLDLRLTLDLILVELTSHLGVDAASMLVSEGQDGLRLFTSAGFRQVRAAVSPHPLSLSVFTSGRAVAISGTELDELLRYNGLATEVFQEAELLPLTAHGQVFGVLQLFRRSPASDESGTRLGIESIAVRAALAVEAWSRRREADSTAPPDLSRDPAQELSAAQLAVFRLLVEGHSNREIAARLHLSENTVKTHLKGIFNRLGVRNRLEAVMTVTAPLPHWTGADGQEITRSGDAISPNR